jgi:hypothetical protein
VLADARRVFVETLHPLREVLDAQLLAGHAVQTKKVNQDAVDSYWMAREMALELRDKAEESKICYYLGCVTLAM